jgi:hypothetical protein
VDGVINESTALKSICVFCGSSTGIPPLYADVARSVGVELAQRQRRLVYGGGSAGLMGLVADAALEAGGEVIGVIPQSLISREAAHSRLTSLHVVATMHQRKALMAELSDAFVALPGGYGTLDEVSEMLTWRQLGLHAGPVGLINVDGYYDQLLAFLDRAVADGFVRRPHRESLCVGRSLAEVLEALEAMASRQGG